MRTPALTRVADLGAIRDLVTSHAGPDAIDDILASQDLPPGILNDPTLRILYRDVMSVYRRASEVIGGKSAGHMIGSSMNMCDLGLWGEYAIQAPTLDEAILRTKWGLRYHETHSTLATETDGSYFRFSYSSIEEGFPGWDQLATFALNLMINLCRHFLGGEWSPELIEVSFKPGIAGRAIESEFGVPVVFNCPTMAIVFDRDDLACENPHTSATVNLIGVQDLDALGAPPRGTMAELVQLFAYQQSTGRESGMDVSDGLDRAGSKLGLSPRTLQRRLAEEGTNYFSVIDDVRHRRSVDLLRNWHFSIEQIGHAVGYSSTSHFTRAFRRWEGVPPSDYRNMRFGPS